MKNACFDAKPAFVKWNTSRQCAPSLRAALTPWQSLRASRHCEAQSAVAICCFFENFLQTLHRNVIKEIPCGSRKRRKSGLKRNAWAGARVSGRNTGIFCKSICCRILAKWSWSVLIRLSCEILRKALSESLRFPRGISCWRLCSRF